MEIHDAPAVSSYYDSTRPGAYCLKIADLSQNDRNMVAKHPLKGALDHLRDALENVEQSYKCNPTPNELTDGNIKTFRRVIGAWSGARGFIRALEWRSDLRASSCLWTCLQGRFRLRTLSITYATSHRESF